MIIQSRRYPEKTHDISIEEWEKMKSNGMSNKFKVISSADIAPDVARPVDVVNFMTVKKIYDEPELESMMKDDLIMQAQDMGIDIPRGALKADIISLIKENQ